MSDKLIIGDGTAQELAAWEARAAHEESAVAEGYCPVHRSAMKAVEFRGSDELLAGHCSPCGRYWWYDTVRGGIGSAADHDSQGGWVAPWLAVRR